MKESTIAFLIGAAVLYLMTRPSTPANTGTNGTGTGNVGTGTLGGNLGTVGTLGVQGTNAGTGTMSAVIGPGVRDAILQQG